MKKIEKLEERVDDCEQYSRCLCVRIDNMAVYIAKLCYYYAPPRCHQKRLCYFVPYRHGKLDLRFVHGRAESVSQ